MNQTSTHRHESKEALRETRLYLRALFDNSLDAILVTNDEARYIDANPAACAMVGYTHDELVQLSVMDLTEPAFREEGWAMWKEFLTKGSNCGEYSVVHKDGTLIQLEFRAVANILPGIHVSSIRDITERKRAEAALRTSEERYRELFENAKDALYGHDLKGRYTSVNRAAERLSGYSREDIIGKKFTDFVPPGQFELINEYFCKKLVEEGETTYETTVIRRDGQRVAVEVSSHLIYENNIPVAVQGTARDITERKRSEDQLRQAKDFSENLIQTANIIIRGLDVQGRINIFNQTAEAITGFAAAEVMGHSWFEKLVPKDIYPDVWEQYVHLVGEGGSKTFENPIRTKSGQERFIRWQNNQVKIDGKVVGVISFGNDITESKQTAEALRQSEERFSKAFHSSPVALSIAQLHDGRLLEVNESFLRMTGYSGNEVIGRTTIEVGLWNEDSRQEMIDALRDNGTLDNMAIQLRRKSGEVRDLVLSAELIHLGDGPCVLCISQDVTERNRTEKALQRYPRQLIEAQESERKHIARELHDQIGQVLTAVRLNLQAIQNFCETEEAQTLIDQGKTLVDGALELVRSLSFELRPSLLDDLGLVTALRWYADQFAQRTGINAKSSTNLPGDQPRFRPELEIVCFRIVQEALTNVARHAAAKNVSISLRAVDHQITLSIKDDGIGFSELPPRAGASAMRLGLMGMRERALVLGGILEIKSGPDLGTEIRASFPIEDKGV